MTVRPYLPTGPGHNADDDTAQKQSHLVTKLRTNLGIHGPTVEETIDNGEGLGGLFEMRPLSGEPCRQPLPPSQERGEAVGVVGEPLRSEHRDASRNTTLRTPARQPSPPHSQSLADLTPARRIRFCRESCGSDGHAVDGVRQPRPTDRAEKGRKGAWTARPCAAFLAGDADDRPYAAWVLAVVCGKAGGRERGASLSRGDQVQAHAVFSERTWGADTRVPSTRYRLPVTPLTVAADARSGVCQHPLDHVGRLLMRLTSRRVDRRSVHWLTGPSAGTRVVGHDWVERTATAVGGSLSTGPEHGLLTSFEALRGPDFDPESVDPRIVHFYEHTTSWRLDLWSEWSAIAWPFGRAVTALFSDRLKH
jgi:hypothetical protein